MKLREWVTLAIVGGLIVIVVGAALCGAVLKEVL